jgi:hypothetical protein
MTVVASTAGLTCGLAYRGLTWALVAAARSRWRPGIRRSARRCGIVYQPGLLILSGGGQMLGNWPAIRR